MHQMKSKNFLISNITLYREVHGRVRYYTLKVYPTLFNEYLLERTYGGLKNKKTTRTIKEYFSRSEDIKNMIGEIVKSKILKDYQN